MSDKDVHQELLRGRQRSKLERAMDVATDWRNWVVLVIGLVVLGDQFGVFSIPRFGDPHKVILMGLVGGYLADKLFLWSIVADRIRGDRVLVALTPVQGQIFDVLSVPKDTFFKWDVFGNSFSERYSLTGEVTFAARGVDFAKDLLVPAGDRPEDSEIPDDIDLIGAGADEEYHKLRGPMLEEFRARTERDRDEQVMKEEAKREVTNEFVELFEEIRAGSVEVNDLDQSEAEKRADEVVRDLALQAGEGDSDE